jgi:Cu+-exporting ATPase
MERIHIDVQGMTCANCASTIADAVESLPGVSEATANYATDEATVEYDPEETSLGEIYDAIEHAGYDPVSETVTIAITDMTCANCASTVEGAVGDLPGVVSVDANFATDEAQVRIDPAAVSREEIYRAVESAGYTPVREDEGASAADSSDARGEARAATTRHQRRLVLFGVALSLPLLVLGMGHMVGLPVPDAPLGIGVGWWLLALATPVQVVLGKEFYENSYTALVRNRRANMDVLVALGSTTAYLYSVLTLTDALAGGLYFDGAALILTFITLGNYLEARSKSQAGDAIRELLELEADTAVVVEEGDDGERIEREVALSEVEVGDLLKVRPGAKVPTDAEVVEGDSAVDESMVTGESVPVEKEPGDEVIGGTVNESGLLYARATKVGEATALQQIVRTVKEAQSRQPDVQRVADRISAYFVPAVITNAVVWALLWFVFPETLAGVVRSLPVWGLVGGGPGTISPLEFSVVVFASAVLIACPCALGLATPAATMVGTAIGARNGILFRGGDVLERVRDVEAVVFDKTGTLTEGEMALTDVEAVGPASDGGVAEAPPDRSGTENETDTLLRLAASAERGSEHPIAEAIVDGARERDFDLSDPDSFRGVAGEGIAARLDGTTVLVGSRRLLARAGIDTDSADAAMERLEREGKTVVLVGRTDASVDAVVDADADAELPSDTGNGVGELLGVLAVADTVKPAARDAVAAFRDRGVAVHLLTGDNERTARAVAEEVGIDPENVRAEVLPEDKAEAVEAIQADGTQAMMVGDGVNDAPALAAASVGVAIGSGTDVAIEAADVTLMRSDPMDAVRALRVSEGTLAKVRQNLFWALGYNTAMIPLASLGLLQPVLAAGAMALSSVSVLTNSLLFRAYDPDEEYRLLGVLR